MCAETNIAQNDLGDESQQALIGLDYIYDERKGALCVETPNFLLLSLFITESQNPEGDFVSQLYPEAEKRGIRIKHAISPVSTHPYISFLEHIPLYEAYPNHAQQVGIEADTVLWKRHVGKMSGVIINGPCSGLIVSPRQMDRSGYVPNNKYPIQKGLSVNRYWNDAYFETPDPNFVMDRSLYLFTWLEEMTNQYFSKQELQKGFIYGAHVNRLLTDVLQMQYEQVFQSVKTRFSDEVVWTSDIFASLCESQGIAISDSFVSNRAIEQD